MPQGEGTYGSSVGRPPKTKCNKKATPAKAKAKPKKK